MILESWSQATERGIIAILNLFIIITSYSISKPRYRCNTVCSGVGFFVCFSGEKNNSPVYNSLNLTSTLSRWQASAANECFLPILPRVIQQDVKSLLTDYSDCRAKPLNHLFLELAKG